MPETWLPVPELIVAGWKGMERAEVMQEGNRWHGLCAPIWFNQLTFNMKYRLRSSEEE